MEILNQKKHSADLAKGLLFLVGVAAICAAIGFLLLRQRDLERYGNLSPADEKQEAVAVLAGKSGAVEVSRRGALQDKALQVGDGLFPGDRVQTGGSANATLAMTTGARITLEQNSLLEMPQPERGAGDQGTVLQLTSGSIHLDSEEFGDVVALYTPQAMIELNPPGLMLVTPPEDASPETAYMAGLANAWFPDPESDAAHRAQTLIEGVHAACASSPDSSPCVKVESSAWSELLILRNTMEKPKHVVLDISIDDSGNENISVASGAVDVTTQERTLRVDESTPLVLDGSMPTQKSLTADSLLAMVPRMPEEEAEPIEKPEVFFEIESMEWQ